METLPMYHRTPPEKYTAYITQVTATHAVSGKNSSKAPPTLLGALVLSVLIFKASITQGLCYLGVKLALI